MGDKTKENINGILKQCVTVMATIILTMVGFWMTIGQNYLTRVEATEIVNSKVERIEEDGRMMSLALKDYQTVLIDLRVQMGALNQTLIHIKEDMKDRHDREARINAKGDNTLFSSKTID